MGNTTKYTLVKDILIILFTLIVAFIIASIFNESLGYSFVIGFVSYLAIRCAIFAPYNPRTRGKIMMMITSCLIMIFTGFAVAINYGPPGLRYPLIGSTLGILFVLGVYLISSILKNGI